MLGPAPGAEGTPDGDPALMPLGPEPCAQCLGQHARLHVSHCIYSFMLRFPPSALLRNSPTQVSWGLTVTKTGTSQRPVPWGGDVTQFLHPSGLGLIVKVKSGVKLSTTVNEEVEENL